MTAVTAGRLRSLGPASSESRQVEVAGIHPHHERLIVPNEILAPTGTLITEEGRITQIAQKNPSERIWMTRMVALAGTVVGRAMR